MPAHASRRHRALISTVFAASLLTLPAVAQSAPDSPDSPDSSESPPAEVPVATLADVSAERVAEAPAEAAAPVPTVPAEPVADHDAVYAEATALSDAGQWQAAADKFRTAIGIRSSAPSWIALGRCEVEQGQLLSAEADFERALADAQRDADQDSIQAAEARLAEVAPLIPVVELILPATAGPVTVTVDGEAAVVEGNKLRVDPGTHALFVSGADGEFEQQIQIERGVQLVVPVMLTPPAPPVQPAPIQQPILAPIAPAQSAPVPPPAPAEADSGSSGPPLGAIILGGAGIVTSVTGLAFYLNGRSNISAATRECALPGRDCEAAASEIDSGESDQDFGRVAMIAGAAAMVGGVVWWAVAAGDDSEEAPGVALSIAPLSDGGYIGLDGAF